MFIWLFAEDVAVEASMLRSVRMGIGKTGGHLRCSLKTRQLLVLMEALLTEQPAHVAGALPRAAVHGCQPGRMDDLESSTAKLRGAAARDRMSLGPVPNHSPSLSRPILSPVLESKTSFIHAVRWKAFPDSLNQQSPSKSRQSTSKSSYPILNLQTFPCTDPINHYISSYSSWAR